MPSQQPCASILSILLMSDAALTEFIQQHRGSDGNVVLPIDGWDALSKDERARLAKRLVAQSLMAHSQPLDLNQLNARLQGISSIEQARRRRVAEKMDRIEESDEWEEKVARQRQLDKDMDKEQEWRETHKEEWEASQKEATESRERTQRENETEAYNNLVKYGSRPLYPIALLGDVSRKPDEYSELLRPWLEPFGPTGRHWIPACGFPTGYGPLEGDDDSGDSWEVFQRQWARWQNFGIWQRDNRWIKDEEDGYPSYVESRKNYMKRYPYLESAESLADIEADPSILKDECWNRALRNRQKQQRLCREHHGGVEFADYVNAVERRLTRHGFTRPFELKEDLTQQDNLTTWIEYLCFEYWWLDQYTDAIDRLKPDYNKAWGKLVESKVLQPHETQEYITTDDCGMRRDAENHQAWEGWKRAQEYAEQVYASTQLDSNRLSIPKAERCRRLKEASLRLEKAKSRLSSTKNRINLIREFIVATQSTRRAEKDAARHRILLPWILEQIALIEAESDQAEAVEHEPDTTGRTKKRVHSDEDRSRGQDTKKRKFSCSSPTRRSDSNAAVATESERLHNAAPAEKGNGFQDGYRLQAGATFAMPSPQTLTNCETAPQGRRRSARITKRQTTAGTVPASQPSRRKQNKRNKYFQRKQTTGPG